MNKKHLIRAMPSLLYTDEEVEVVRSEGKDILIGTEHRQREWSKVLAKYPKLFWIGDTGVRRKARALWEKYAKLVNVDRKARKSSHKSNTKRSRSAKAPEPGRAWKSRRAGSRFAATNNHHGTNAHAKISDVPFNSS